MATTYHDWESDPRPFREALRAWMVSQGYDSAQEAADALGVRFTTFKGWLYQSRPCPYETAFRRLMRAIDRGLI